MENQAASWAPKDMIAGGGAGFPGGLLRIQNARFVMRNKKDYRYEPAQGNETVVLFAFGPEHSNEAGEVVVGEDELYSVGNGYALGMLDADGNVVQVPAGVFEGQFFIGPALKKNSNFGIFVENLFGAGYKGEAGPTVPIESLNGTVCMTAQIPQIDFKTQKPRVNDKGYPVMSLVPTEVKDAAPWDAPKAPAGRVVAKAGAGKAVATPVAVAAPKAGAAKVAAPTPSAGAVDEGVVLGVIAAILGATPSITKAKLYSAVYTAVGAGFPELEKHKAQLVKDVTAMIVANEHPELFSFDAASSTITAS